MDFEHEVTAGILSYYGTVCAEFGKVIRRRRKSETSLIVTRFQKYRVV